MMIFFSTSCSQINFTASGETPFKISANKQSELAFEKESTADFYFWGYSPGIATVDLDNYTSELELENPSYVSVEQSFGFKSLFYTFITLGLYCPVDYKVSLFRAREH